DHLLGRLRGDAAEVGGRVVPLTRDVALFVELLRDDPDLAGLDVDLDERFLGGIGHALVRGDERVGERFEHDLLGDPLLDRERHQRLEHLRVLHAVARLRSAVARPAAARALLRDSRGGGPHSKTVRAWVMSAYATSRRRSSPSTTHPRSSASTST